MSGKSKIAQVKEDIEAMIRQGKYAPGEQLPSEPELAEEFNVSRGTVRQSLSELAREAIVSRRSGAGTIVIRQPKPVQIMAFTEQIKAAGLTPKTKVLATEQIMAEQAGRRVCEAFLLLDSEEAARTPVYRIDRLRCGDDKPLAQQTVYLLASDFKTDLLQKHDFTTSLFALYRRYHRRVTSAHETIKARPATPEEIDLFQMTTLPPPQQFVYERHRISYDQENRVLEVMHSVDRGDFFHGYQYRIVEDEAHLMESQNTVAAG